MKATVCGAGNVGATLAQRLYETGYMDVVLTDAVEGRAEGKALDMLESGPVLGRDSQIVGCTNDYKPTANSDVVVITAGIARKPGMSRDELFSTNAKIVTSVMQGVLEHSPNAIFIIVSNPLDAMVQLAYEVSGLQKNQVFGMAGVLDTARFQTFLALELNVSVKDVNAYVLGGHGDLMVPLISATNVAGVPIGELIKPARLEEIVQRTRDGGAEIVNLLGASGYYAPSAATAEMVEAVLLDKKQILPCAALLEGEYGVNGYYTGVPAKLGARGVESIVELELSTTEKEQFAKSVDAVKKLVELVRSLN